MKMMSYQKLIKSNLFVKELNEFNEKSNKKLVKSELSVSRVWVKFDIKPNIMVLSMLPDMYFLISLAYCGVSGHFKQHRGVITVIDML